MSTLNFSITTCYCVIKLGLVAYQTFNALGSVYPIPSNVTIIISEYLPV